MNQGRRLQRFGVEVHLERHQERGGSLGNRSIFANGGTPTELVKRMTFSANPTW
jgi:hypothetical protein